MSGDARLVVIADGRTLPDEEARAIWRRFSAHLDAHENDFAGFARKEGVASAKTESRAGKAVLVLGPRLAS